MTTTHLGLEVREDTSDASIVDEIFTKKTYERRYFRPGMTTGEVWGDLGANVGAFAAKYAGQVEAIHCFEPSQETFEILERNTAPYPNVTCHQVAVSNYTGAATFYERRHMNSRNSLHKLFKRKVTTAEVPVIHAANIPSEINSLKIDIEGSEQEVLYALDLQPIDRMVMEWSFDFLPEMQLYLDAVAYLEENFDRVKARTNKLPEHTWTQYFYPRCILMWAWNETEDK